MIDPNERLTSIFKQTLVADWPVAYDLAPVPFVAQDDCVLRQVTFGSVTGGTIDAMVSAAPNLDQLMKNEPQREFQLLSQEKLSWTDLAFPLLKGSRIYFGFKSGLTDPQLISLIFTS